MTFGEIVKYLRMKHGLTQEEFASALGLKKSSIQKYEAGAVCNLKISTLRILCERFNMPPYVFIYPEKVQDLDSASWSHSPGRFVGLLADLNEEGVEMVARYAADLAASGNYKI